MTNRENSNNPLSYLTQWEDLDAGGMGIIIFEDAFTDADELMGQPGWPTTDSGVVDTSVAGPRSTSAGLGPAQCIAAPGVPAPLAPTASSGSPQPASRATPPAPAAASSDGGRGAPSPYSPNFYGGSNVGNTQHNHQLPSVETLFPLQQQQQQQQQQQHHQHHHHQPQKSYRELGGYMPPGGGGVAPCAAPSPGLPVSPPGGAYCSPPHCYPPGPHTYTTPPQCSPPSSYQVIVANPLRVKSEQHYDQQHRYRTQQQEEQQPRQQCDPSWDGRHDYGVPGRTPPPPGLVKPDPDGPLSGPSASATCAHSPSSIGDDTPPSKKPHPRQGYRRPTYGDPKKEKRREQNRRAALKCREKKKSEWAEMHADFKRLETENVGLQQKISNLEEEKRKLRELLRSHQQTCPLQLELPPTTPP